MKSTALPLLFLFARHFFTAQASQIARGEHRIPEKSPPEHDVGDRRKALPYAVNIRFVDEIAVIAERHRCAVCRERKCTEMDRPPVKLLLHARVDNELGERKLVVDFENRRKLRRIFDADPGLDAKLHVGGELLKDELKKPPERLAFRQKTGALLLRRDRARRTAEVQIEFLVAVVSQDFRGKEKILRVVR